MRQLRTLAVKVLFLAVVAIPCLGILQWQEDRLAAQETRKQQEFCEESERVIRSIADGFQQQGHSVSVKTLHGGACLTPTSPNVY